MVPKAQPNRPPSIEVLLRRDRSTNPLLRTNGPVLLEGPRSLDRRLVDAGAGVKHVCAFLEGEVSLQGPRLSGCENVVGLDDIVLDERVPSPPVESKVAWARGVVRSVVLDDPSS